MLSAQQLEARVCRARGTTQLPAACRRGPQELGLAIAFTRLPPALPARAGDGTGSAAGPAAAERRGSVGGGGGGAVGWDGHRGLFPPQRCCEPPSPTSVVL